MLRTTGVLVKSLQAITMKERGLQSHGIKANVSKSQVLLWKMLIMCPLMPMS